MSWFGTGTTMLQGLYVIHARNVFHIFFLELFADAAYIFCKMKEFVPP
jgi:hypothetical protein